MTVYYDDQQMCSLLDELERKLPLTHRGLVISRHPANKECRVTIGGAIVLGDNEDYGFVYAEIGGAVEMRDCPTIAMFAYAVAHALDGSQQLVLPLRTYVLDKSMDAVAAVVAGVSPMVAETIVERFVSQRDRLLGAYDVYRNGPLLSALIVGGAGVVVRPTAISQADAAQADRRVMRTASAHAMLTIAMGWTLAKGPGERVVGKA